jgi:hypothetical protein
MSDFSFFSSATTSLQLPFHDKLRSGGSTLPTNTAFSGIAQTPAFSVRTTQAPSSLYSADAMMEAAQTFPASQCRSN